MSAGTILKAINGDFKKRVVWAKGTPIPGYDPDMWRYDAFFWIMKWTDHADGSSAYGWEMDHLAGSDEIDNLRPLHYANNASLGGLGDSSRALATVNQGK